MICVPALAWMITEAIEQMRHADLQDEADRDDWHGQIVERVQPLEEL